MSFLGSRPLLWFIFVGCIGSVLVAMGLTHFMGLEPCPLCIMQRVAFVLMGLAALVAALSPRSSRVGFCVFGGLSGLFGAIGLAVAARHLWVASHPVDTSCSPFTLEQMAQRLPIGNWLPKVLAGEAECEAAAHWTLLGLNLPGWSALLFVVFLLVLIAAFVDRLARRPTPRAL